MHGKENATNILLLYIYIEILYKDAHRHDECDNVTLKYLYLI